MFGGAAMRSKRVLVTGLLAAVMAVAAGSSTTTAAADDKGKNNSVAADLGGFGGILNFLDALVVPAVVTDGVTGPFFARVLAGTGEQPGDIEQCLAMLLDHDLGGSSPHFGFVLADGHQCRSSMTEIHRGLNIPDFVIDRFIMIVGMQAQIAGVPDADIAQVAKVLDRYRGGVRNK
jgi:hypothetical protein